MFVSFIHVNARNKEKLIEEKGPICKQHLELGFDLIEFHEFCFLSVSVGGYQEIRKKGPHVGIT